MKFDAKFARRNIALTLFALLVTATSALAARNPATTAEIDARDVLQPVAAPWAPVGTHFDMAPDAYPRLSRVQNLTLTNVRLTDTLAVDLTLERFYSSALGAQFIIAGDNGEERVAQPAVATFRGTAANYPGSWAVIGLTHNKAFAIVHLGAQEEYWLAPPGPEMAGMPHVMYERFSSADHFGPSNFRCSVETPQTPQAAPPPGAVPPDSEGDGGGIAGGYPWRVVELALDGDYEYRQLFATPNDALDYMCLLVAMVSQIYEQHLQIKLWIVYARVWNTVNDPYNAGNTLTQLDQFRDYWNNNMGSIGRNTAHLLSGRDLGGGRAHLAALCDEDSYGVEAVGGTFPYPVQNRNASNWDLIVLAHELGHSVGSPHTHCYDPPIDTCAGTGYDCTHPQVCQVGTIMSYCHLCPGGTANIDLSFGTRVEAVIRGFISDECPRSGRNPCYVDGAYGGSEQGTASQPYNTALEGIAWVIPNGTVSMRPGAYNQTFTLWNTLNRPLRIERWGTSGVVRIGAP